MTTRADDLTILLRVRDLTKGPIAAMSRRIKAIGPVMKGVAAAGAVVFGTLALAISAAATNGRDLALALESTSRQLNLSMRETQAFQRTVAEITGVDSVDTLNQSMLTYKELVADAQVGAGALYGLIEDKGLNIDLGLDNGRAQLANFLTEVNKLPTANDRIFALKELGDEFADVFLPVINNVEKTNELIKELERNVNDFPNLLTQDQQDNVVAYKDSVRELSRAWDELSLQVFGNAAPALTRFNELLTSSIKFLRDVNQASKNLHEFVTNTMLPSLDKALTGLYEKLPQGLRDAIGGTIDFVSDYADGALQQYGVLWDKIKDVTEEGVQNLKNYAGSNLVTVSVPMAFATGDPSFDPTNINLADETRGVNYGNSSFASNDSNIRDDVPTGSVADRERAAREAMRAREEAEAEHVRKLMQPYQIYQDLQVELTEMMKDQEAIRLANMNLAREGWREQMLRDEQAERESQERRREAWLMFGDTINQALDAAKSPVGSYIKITEAMTDAEKKAAERSNKINRDRFEQNKAFGRAQAAVSAAIGISRALEQPWPLNLLAAAQTAIAAYAQLDAINGTEFGSPQTAATVATGGGNTSAVVPEVGNGPVAGAIQGGQNRRIDLEVSFDGIDDDDILLGIAAKQLAERVAEEALLAA